MSLNDLSAHIKQYFLSFWYAIPHLLRSYPSFDTKKDILVKHQEDLVVNIPYQRYLSNLFRQLLNHGLHFIANHYLRHLIECSKQMKNNSHNYVS